jgi:hypothetical protein
LTGCCWLLLMHVQRTFLLLLLLVGRKHLGTTQAVLPLLLLLACDLIQCQLCCSKRMP